MGTATGAPQLKRTFMAFPIDSSVDYILHTIYKSKPDPFGKPRSIGIQRSTCRELAAPSVSAAERAETVPARASKIVSPFSPPSPMRRLPLFFSLFCLFGPCLMAEDRPNIIYIMLDEWGYFESSVMEHRILDTPNIDRLSNEGTRFAEFLAGANVCAPTRNVLMTGQHTGHTTIRGNRGSAPIRDEDFTLAEMLKPAGYTSGGFGKWGLGDVGTSGVPERQGFEVFFGYYHQVHAHTYYPRYLIKNSERVPLPGNTGDLHTGETFAHYLIHEAGMAFIREHHDRPFFAYLAWTPLRRLQRIPNLGSAGSGQARRQLAQTGAHLCDRRRNHLW